MIAPIPQVTPGTVTFRRWLESLHFKVNDRGTATTAQLDALTSRVNTANKWAGRQRFNTDTNRPIWAAGGEDSALWLYADGTTAHTPA